MTRPPHSTDQLVSTTYPVQRREDTLSPDVVILGEPSPENPFDKPSLAEPAQTSAEQSAHSNKPKSNTDKPQ